MMKWPEIQVKVQEEIARVIGNDTPSLNHRSKTPYVEATLLEIQRLACIVPWGPRATLDDVQVKQCSILCGICGYGKLRRSLSFVQS